MKYKSAIEMLRDGSLSSKEQKKALSIYLNAGETYDAFAKRNNTDVVELKKRKFQLESMNEVLGAMNE